MKALYAVILSLFAMTAHAEEIDQAGQQDIFSVFAKALAIGVCSVVEQPNSVSIDGEVPLEPFADNKDLHGCQYISETLASGCSQDQSCTSYDEWTAMHPSISPRLPRQVFLQNLSERQAELKNISFSTLALK